MASRTKIWGETPSGQLFFCLIAADSNCGSARSRKLEHPNQVSALAWPCEAPIVSVILLEPLEPKPKTRVTMSGSHDYGKDGLDVKGSTHNHKTKTQYCDFVEDWKLRTSTPIVILVMTSLPVKLDGMLDSKVTSKADWRPMDSKGSVWATVWPRLIPWTDLLGWKPPGAITWGHLWFGHPKEWC